ncbi:hypothetical protein FOB41_15110 [Agrobacterium pusense]|uniref:Uncharacterized protein n=1 Tax=Agrobacterium pusense TaxID=648995 RepID=A0A6H0ZP16_9HYPH|nr:hypothetical protein [Agrobacterium pusense]QIX22379.1 hypothetical protein FOB41_15110 [Agrobacterium pusense]
MTQTFKFDVAQKPVGPGLHSYEAIDRANGKRIDMPKGGTEGIENLVGSYPEIQAYLEAEYGVKTDLSYRSGINVMERRDDGVTWSIPRAEDGILVIVYDINRTVWSIG